MTLRRTWRPVTPGFGPPISTSVSEDEAAMLAQLAAGKNVLEIGSAYGYSAVVMGLAGATTVTAVDPHTWLPSLAPMKDNLLSYNVADRVVIVAEGAETAVPRFQEDGFLFDLVWIDGDHSEPAVIRDVELALSVLAPGGVLACHDYDEESCPGVRPALDATVGEPHELVGTLAIYRGLK